MSLFKNLFGDKSDKKANIPEIKPTAPAANAGMSEFLKSLENQGITFRPAHCDCCGQDTPSAFHNKQNAFVILGVQANSAGHPHNVVPFVGACEKCDIDVCQACAKWNHEAAEKVFKPACPRCGCKLQSKTSIDRERLSAGFKVVYLPPSRETMALARRTLRILEEERPDYVAMMGEESDNRMRKGLMNFIAKCAIVTGNKQERAAFFKSKLRDLHEQKIAIDALLADTKLIDSKFDDRIRGYPLLMRIVRMAELDDATSQEECEAEGLRLEQTLESIAGQNPALHEMRLVMLHERTLCLFDRDFGKRRYWHHLIEAGTECTIDLAGYPNLTANHEWVAVMRSVQQEEPALIKEVERFEAELLHDLE